MSLETPASDTYGWITDIPADVTIQKTRAVRMYLLNPEDLDGIRFNDRFYQTIGRYFKEYRERDIEWRAWKVHGGPAGFWKFLKQQSQRGVLQSNLLPYGYRPGARYDLNLPHPPKLQDRYICDSPVLRDAKAALAPWIWDTCNVVLNYVFLEGGIPLTSDDLTPSREDAMRRAVSFMRSNHRYADRPDQPLGPSPSMTLLREAISQAPIAPAPGSAQWGTAVQGLDFISTKTNNHYDWNAEYLGRVFTAAIGVVEELGTGRGGMFTACWEIYDKYSQSPGFGLWYNPTSGEWQDNATNWLDPKRSSEGLRGHIRNKCSAGLAYNDLLPGSQ